MTIRSGNNCWLGGGKSELPKHLHFTLSHKLNVIDQAA